MEISHWLQQGDVLKLELPPDLRFHHSLVRVVLPLLISVGRNRDETTRSGGTGPAWLPRFAGVLHHIMQDEDGLSSLRC
jgi:hypothetical protein